MSADIGQLADRLNLGWYGGDSGVNFARRTETAAKHIARQRVLSMFSQRKWTNQLGKRNLSILTMPGLDWSFEYALLSMRERPKRAANPCFTGITAIERSEPIWTAAMLGMPGASESLTLAIPHPEYARGACRTKAVGRFYLASFEEFALSTETQTYVHDAAWIDLCGPVTELRLEALAALWERKLRSVLIVTSLHARWPAGFAATVKDAGGVSSLLAKRLGGSVVVDDYRYADRSPMHQVVLRKAAA